MKANQLNRKEQPNITNTKDFDLSLMPYKTFTLNNNIKAYWVQAGVQEVANIEFVFLAGNTFENQIGIAAAVNSLIKNGTTTRTAYQLNEAFEFYGATCKRACYNETATVTLTCLSKYLTHLLPIVNDIFTNAIFQEKEIETYITNAIQSLSINLTKSDIVANRLIDEYVYGFKHPYGVYSTVESYQQITKENLEEFYKKYYLNGQLSIFISGNLPDNIIEQLESDINFKNLTPLPTNLNQNIKVNPSKEFKVRKSINEKPGMQGSIRLAIPTINRTHPDFTKLVVVNTILGGYFGSRLMSNIREDKGYTYGIYSYIQNHIGNTCLLISTEAGKDVCEKTIKEIYYEINELQINQISDEELDLVKNYVIGTIVSELDSPFNTINRWKNIILNNLNQNYFNQSVQAVKNITAKEIKELANKYLIKEDFYELVVI